MCKENRIQGYDSEGTEQLMDRLEAIMNKQRELQARVDNRLFSDDPAERAAYMRDQRGYLADEVAEALYEMPHYKLWKNYSDMTAEAYGMQWQKVRMELIDALHFFVNLMLCADMSAEEVYQMYMAKNKENFRRQDAGYTSDVSYRDQSVSDVMQPSCSVSFNGNLLSTDTFVTMLESEDNTFSFVYAADAAMLGMAAAVFNDAYRKELSTLSEEEREEVRKAAAAMYNEYKEGNNE